jgi:hypothetical protein
VKHPADVSNVINLDIGQENVEQAGLRMYTNMYTCIWSENVYLEQDAYMFSLKGITTM